MTSPLHYPTSVRPQAATIGPLVAASMAFLIVVGAGTGKSAHAHQGSISNNAIQVSEDQRTVTYRLQIQPADAAEILLLDDVKELTRTRLGQSHGALFGHILPRITIGDGRRTCENTAGDIRVLSAGESGTISGDRRIEIAFTAHCTPALETLHVGYDLFFATDPLHRALVHIRHGGDQVMTQFDPESRTYTWILGAPPKVDAAAFAASFIVSGIEHIVFGFDHLAFLAALLLVVILRQRPIIPHSQRPLAPYNPNATDDTTEKIRPLSNHSIQQWGIKSFRDSVWDTAAIVTAFTVAHSITLVATSLHWIELKSWLPGWLVESIIAASIVYVAVENIVRPQAKYRYRVTFAFGLIHGFGFAAMLEHLLPAEGVLWPLCLFNLGVELGQLGIVIVCLPLLHLAAKALGSHRYRWHVMPLAAGVLAILGALWLAERTMDITILGF